jgi:uncharacterized protein YdeI (YjbR/CyaY-like superfamily)
MDLYRALGEDAAIKTAWGKLDSTAKRNACDWIEDSEDKIMRRARIVEVCARLAT